MKKLITIIIFLISTSSFSENNNLYPGTQYPGCPPENSTASELDTKPIKYYPAQKPLSKEAIEANQAIHKQQN